jgi:hypothetical protein
MAAGSSSVANQRVWTAAHRVSTVVVFADEHSTDERRTRRLEAFCGAQDISPLRGPHEDEERGCVGVLARSRCGERREYRRSGDDYVLLSRRNCSTRVDRLSSPVGPAPPPTRSRGRGSGKPFTARTGSPSPRSCRRQNASRCRRRQPGPDPFPRACA